MTRADRERIYPSDPAERARIRDEYWQRQMARSAHRVDSGTAALEAQQERRRRNANGIVQMNGWSEDGREWVRAAARKAPARSQAPSVEHPGWVRRFGAVVGARMGEQVTADGVVVAEPDQEEE